MSTNALGGKAASRPLALFAYGFRPFFLLGPAYGALSLLAWVAIYLGVLALPLAWTPMVWHAHEMVFGFAMAGMAGFMLTAVPNWTGAAPVRGKPLLLLVLLWAAGRIALWSSAVVPAPLVALIDLAFIPALALAVAPPLLAQATESGPRNLVFFALLGLLWTGDLLTHLDALVGVSGGPLIGLHLGVDVFLLAIALVGGRIIPSFTAAALRTGAAPPPRSIRGLELAAMLSVAGFLVSDLAFGAGPITGMIAACAAAANGTRLALWRPLATLRTPILAVLHLGYAWLVVSLGLAAGADLSDGALLAPTAALHALTAGAIPTMLLGVMSRASLGHTGRAMQAPPLAVAAYASVGVAALLRIIAPVTGTWVPAMIAASGVLWALAMLQFLIVFAPILSRARVDGQPG